MALTRFMFIDVPLQFVDTLASDLASGPKADILIRAALAKESALVETMPSSAIIDSLLQTDWSCLPGVVDHKFDVGDGRMKTGCNHLSEGEHPALAQKKKPLSLVSHGATRCWIAARLRIRTTVTWQRGGAFEVPVIEAIIDEKSRTTRVPNAEISVRLQMGTTRPSYALERTPFTPL